MNCTSPKFPLLFLPHGAMTDGGAAFLLSSYVLATYDSPFSILNPSRGLSLDPTGLSWWWPRLGQEFEQESVPYLVGCALSLGLTGYKANYQDMMETGLATHYIESSEAVPVL